MVIQSDRRPPHEKVRRYNGPQTSEIATVIPVAEEGILSCQDIVLRRSGKINFNGNEVIDTIPGPHPYYDPLTYVLLLLHDTDGWRINMSLQDSSSRRRQSSKTSSPMF